MLSEARRQKGLWWDMSWNPVTGCTKISEGCKNCWAERLATTRLKGRHGYSEREPFEVAYQWSRLAEHRKWKSPRKVFVCSMGDLFHEDVGSDFCCCLVERMQGSSQHTFMLLTKRPENIAQKLEDWFRDKKSVLPPNVWLGVSVENDKRGRERIPVVLGIPAALHFVNCEPLLEEIDIRPWLGDWGAMRMKWVVAGCESGPGRRRAKRDWFRKLRDQCLEARVPFFLKQMAEKEDGSGKVIHAPILDGRRWLQDPGEAA